MKCRYTVHRVSDGKQVGSVTICGGSDPVKALAIWRRRNPAKAMMAVELVARF